MFCVHCGTKLDDNMKFCWKCGAPTVTFTPGPGTVKAAPVPEPVPELKAAPVSETPIPVVEAPAPEPVQELKGELVADFQAEPMPKPPAGVFKPDSTPAPTAELKAAPQPTPDPELKATPQPTPAADTTASTSRDLPTSYCAINIMEYGDYGWPYVYPGIDEEGRIIEEDSDHGLGMVMAKSIEVARLAKNEDKYRTVMRVSDIKMEVYVSDARIIFLCDQYSKGGTWTGGLTAIALTAIERGVAKARTRGKTMAGHIRYEWIKHIMYIRKSGLLSNESLRIVYSDKSGDSWRVEVSFGKDVDSSIIANDIMHRAAFLRTTLNNDDNVVPESSMQFYREHAQANALIEHNPAKNTFSVISFPENFKAPAGENRNPEWN
ncbi:MAG: zinc-ribbon domain-containing protein [Lachnospiraceae bacterium]|nr:zinc-ribbon domain-containing protein [Lachnospiraceae bacterium]